MTKQTGEEQLAYLRNAIENAPKHPRDPAYGLSGFVVGVGMFVCSHCSGRIYDRGCHPPLPCESIWEDRQYNDEKCVLCGTVKKGTCR